MALAERIYGEHKDFNGQEWRVSIYQEAWGDAAVEMTLRNPPFSITWDNTGDEITTPIKSSTCSAYFYNMPDNDDVNNLLDDLRAAEEQTFYIKILKGSTLFWCGPILQDLYSHADEYKTVVNIQAIDGLGRLKDIPYPTTFSEFETCYDQLVDLLNLTGLNQFWGSTDTFISSNVNWYENQMYTTVPATSLEPLKVTRLHTDVFYKEEPSETSGDGQRPEPETISSYEAIENILAMFGARLHLEAGRWWVLQPSAYNGTDFYLRSMRKDGTVNTTVNYTHTYTINQTNLVRANIGYDYLPAFKQVNILHNVRSNKLLPRNKGFRTANYPDDDISYTLPSIQGNNNSLLKLLYQINIYTTSGSATPFLFEMRAEVEFRCIESGTSYYLRKNPTTGKGEWSTTAGTYKVFIGSLKGDDQISGEVIIPEPPWTYATTNTINITYTTGILRGNVFTPLSIPVNIGTWLNLVILPNGADESDIFYKADNATYPLQSVVFEMPEVLIGDQSTRSQINGVEVLNASAAWVASANWKIGGSGDAQRILGLLTQTTLGMQKSPVQRITGDIHIRATSDIGFVSSISFNSIVYIPISFTFTPANDGVVLSGEWVAISLVTSGTTLGNSIKNFQINADVMKGLGALQRQVTAIGNALSSLMYESTVVAWLSAELSGSSITSVPTVALVDPIFKDGDTLLIISSEDESLQEEIVVDANPSDGGSSITIVSKTFTNTYPPGSQVRPKRHSIIADDVIISGMLRVDNMPTSDPGIPGQLYSDVGTIKIS